MSESDADGEALRKIIEAAQSGDLDAVGSLYDSHINRVYRYTLARLGNVHDTEDVAEEIFFRMLAELTAYDRRGASFETWLMAIAATEVERFLRGDGDSRSPSS